MLSSVLQTIDSRREQSIAALKEFLAIPSISARLDNQIEMKRCAHWLADHFKFAGLDVKVMPTGGGKGHPIIVARNKHVAGRPTVLFYGHYDVQPPEPLELWTTPPFEPAIRNNAIFARGAADDKGQVWAHVEAIMAWQAHSGLPVNLIALVEGEEEVGSANLAAFIREHKENLRADVAVVSDSSQYGPGIPAITYGVRGIVYCEVTITGPAYDLHSGVFGGAVANPANVLCQLLATLHDRDGRVNIRGFYDKVRPLAADERAMWAKLPQDDAKLAAEMKLPAFAGEPGYSTFERTWVRPTCDINGMTSGYQGPGEKTIIPSKASAKISMRLVPDQDPVAIRQAFAEALKQRCPKTVTIEVTGNTCVPPMLVPMHSPAMELASEAVEIGFGIRPTLIRTGGSLPVLELIKSVLGVDTLLVGFGLPDDRPHGPNEKFDLDGLFAGSRTAAALYEKLAKLPIKSS
jgi:acetylornithine deacetylase/succinyl-diaminopimelate desuccinylase-like protein